MTNPKLRVEDKFDIASAQKIIDLGYPANSEYISDMLFWCCFPNDPVAGVFYPYLEKMDDSVLASHIPDFLEFNLQEKQDRLIEDVFNTFINARGQEFRNLVLKASKSNDVKKLFDLDQYAP